MLMKLSIHTHLRYAAQGPCDLLLQIEPFTDDAQHIHDAHIHWDAASTQHAIVGETGLGTRRWVCTGSNFEVHFDAKATVTRTASDFGYLTTTPRTSLPSDIIQYLMPSRYCHPELFLEFASTQFHGLAGGPLVKAMSDWIQTNFTYDSMASAIGATATDSFQSQSGVCRDYAHVLITLVRAAGIPARYVSVYAPDVIPKDFHAVVEVYLNNAWHLVDPTGMANPTEMVCICVGRDAADTSFLTSYGWMDLQQQSVTVRRIPS